MKEVTIALAIIVFVGWLVISFCVGLLIGDLIDKWRNR